MPHVAVHFDPQNVSQVVVDRLKKALPSIVAGALSYKAHRSPDTRVEPTSILVFQAASHPTDQNVSPLEVVIQAGQLHGREEVRVGQIVEAGILASGIIPKEYLEQCCIWLRFSEHNDFRFIDGKNYSDKG